MDFVYKDILLVPFIIAVSGIFTTLGFNKKLIPIVDVIIGVILGVVYMNPTDIKLGILQGVFMGLTACGAYSGGKNVYEGVNKE